MIVIGIGAIGLISGGAATRRARSSSRPSERRSSPSSARPALAFYALIGFEDSVNLAEETQEPRRDFPRALFGGLADRRGRSTWSSRSSRRWLVPTGDARRTPTGPLLEVVKGAGSTFPPGLFAVIALLRGHQRRADQHDHGVAAGLRDVAARASCPRVLGRVHRPRQTPYVAIVFTTAIALALVASGDLAGSGRHDRAAPAPRVRVVNVSVLVLRRDPVDHAHFRAPTAMPVIGMGICLALIVQKAVDAPEDLLFGGGLLVLGAVLYLINRAATGPAEPVDPAALAGD